MEKPAWNMNKNPTHTGIFLSGNRLPPPQSGLDVTTNPIQTNE